MKKTLITLMSGLLFSSLTLAAQTSDWDSVVAQAKKRRQRDF